MDEVVLAFRTNARLEEGPYFEGYFGEHISQHPGMEQKAGPFVYHGMSLCWMERRVEADVIFTRQRRW